MVNFLWFSPRIYLKHVMSSHSRTCSDNLDPRVRPEDDESRGRRLRGKPMMAREGRGGYGLRPRMTKIGGKCYLVSIM